MDNGNEKISGGRRRDSFSEALRESTPCPETGKAVSEELLTVESLLAEVGDPDTEMVLLLRERKPIPEDRTVPWLGTFPGHEQCLV